jgi:AbrB family looped-hinge helix DNA binding protein
MKVTTKGQVTIPQAIREHLGITPNTEVDFLLQDNQVLLVAKKNAGKKSRFASVVGILNGKWTTDQIMKMTRE